MADDARNARPIEYYRKFLEEDVRPDGRELGEIRPTVLNIGSITTADGSALVKLGNTTVICGIKAELASPKVEDPCKGYIVPNVDLPPLCSSHFKPGPPSEQAQVLSQLVANIIKDSSCILAEDLCIKESKLCWVLNCDMMCLDYDGNAVDACIIALLAALKDCSLPVITRDEETGNIKTDLEQKKSLTLHSLPVATTFGIFDNHILLADPTNEEESLITGVITVVTTDGDKICTVHKPGGSPISENKLQDCVIRAFQRATEIRKLIDETLNSVQR